MHADVAEETHTPGTHSPGTLTPETHTPGPHGKQQHTPHGETQAARSPARPRGASSKRPPAAKPGAHSPEQAPPIPWDRILHEANTRFGIRRLRSGQRDVLEQVFRGRSVLGLMPTGAGKSLTYQLPALFLPRPVVVVSPLIALMQDQEEKAERADIVVEKLDSTITAGEARQAEIDIEHGTAQLIYVTPERLETPDFLSSMKEAGGISLLVVDEAHCIAQWGHDFRPAYLGIGDSRKALGNPPVLALSATATAEVVDEILKSLHAADATVINAGTERPNLTFSVHPTVNTEAKLSRVTSLLADEEGTGIIYTASVRSANELHAWLTEHGVAVGRYHGQMKIREREEVQRSFMRGDHKAIIATKAFGLGIDKPDIRFVYHFEFPDSLETYYQEAGRAGRDGLPSRAILLYRLEDKRIQSYFLGGRYPKLAELQKVWQTLAGDPLDSPPPAVSVQAPSSPPADRSPISPAPPPTLTLDRIAEHSGVGCRRSQVILHLLTEAGIVHRVRRGYTLAGTEPPDDNTLANLLGAYEQRARHDKEKLEEMMHYAEAVDCRVSLIRQYFGEAAGEPCGRCDNCQDQAAGTADSHGRRVLAEATAQTRRQTPGSAAAASVEQPPAAPAITHHETMHGNRVTEAPAPPASAPEPPPLLKGAAVRHRRFGDGRVKDSTASVALVHFIKAGEKKVQLSYLTRL